MASQEGLKALSSAILDDARRRGEEILGNAQERADSILRQAREAATARRQAVLAETQRDVDGYKRQVASTARIEAKSLLLAKREEIMSLVFEMARDHLRASLKSEERRAALDRLTLEAAITLGGGKLTVRTNEKDGRFLTPDFLADIESRVSATGLAANLGVGPSVDVAGGVVVENERGRVTCDNTFEARLERRKWTLRNEVWKLLAVGAEGEEARLEEP